MNISENDYLIINKDNNIYCLFNKNSKIEKFLISEKIYFKDQFDYFYISKYALIFLHEKKFINASKKILSEKIKEILNSINFKIYKELLKQNYFVMSDSNFGCLFSVYKKFSISKKNHSVFLIFKNFSNLIEINRISTILKKRCFIATEKNGKIIFLEIKREKKI